VELLFGPMSKYLNLKLAPAMLKLDCRCGKSAVLLLQSSISSVPQLALEGIVDMLLAT